MDACLLHLRGGLRVEWYGATRFKREKGHDLLGSPIGSVGIADIQEVLPVGDTGFEVQWRGYAVGPFVPPLHTLHA